MKLFVLAAGKGTRLWPLTKNLPKSLIELGDGTTLLERQLINAINSKLFDEIIIITGYKSEQIEAKIIDYQKNIKISTYYNPFYDMTNNLISLWTVSYRMLEDDFMITNGDNMYKNDVFEKVRDTKEGIEIFISRKDSYDDDDMKVILSQNQTVVKVHKEIATASADAESVGLTSIKGLYYRKLFVNTILKLIKIPEYLNKFWLEIFNSLVEDGVLINVKEIDKDMWKEIDFHPDVELIKKKVFEGF